MRKLVILLVSFATTSVLTLAQQQQSVIKSAPLPAQIITAKKVFISNAGAQWDSHIWSGDSARPYNQFYAAIRDWGHYDIVSMPGDADLVLQISFAQPMEDISVNGSSGSTSGSGIKAPQLRLALLDPKTDVLLWELTERLQFKVGLKKMRDKVFDGAMSDLVSDLKTLTMQPPPKS